jgi:hypothetical protein
MVEDGSYVFGASFLSAKLSASMVLLDGPTTYICEQKFAEVLNGHGLINIDGTYSIRLITRCPRICLKFSRQIIVLNMLFQIYK